MPGILAVDYGERRIGLAVGEPETGLAFPLRVAEVRGEAEAIAAVRAACAERRADRVVVGLPLNMDGTRGPQAQRAAAFAARLAEALGLPVDLWDERLTSREVGRTLLAADLSRSRRRQVTDKLAAQVLLQSYLDASAHAAASASANEP
jgi:putative Holliday junction resolvase